MWSNDVTMYCTKHSSNGVDWDHVDAQKREGRSKKQIRFVPAVFHSYIPAFPRLRPALLVYPPNARPLVHKEKSNDR
ncbi:hypothetical protein VTN00DRAFT_1695 [Thermoascus crustaceus]|uniref:uncharacterized protein n=1 Tax=Thermoascus crustaceus TaxID=5088 RepID=UPI0037440411